MIGQALGYIVGRFGFIKPSLFAGAAAIGLAVLPGLMPSPEPEPEPEPARRAGGHNRLVVRADSDNQCLVSASLNGSRLKLLLDSGANTPLVLSLRMAAAIGVDPSRVTFDQPYNSANGVGYSGRITVRQLRIGDVIFRDVPALVNQEDMGAGLLGMPILQKLNYRLSGRSCILQW
jgi:clan AA aspartic protease (TIGR02281 family)